MRVVAALSGGVDSAVAAALAVDAGHDVVGVHLALAAASDPNTGPPLVAGSATNSAAAVGGESGRTRGCCTIVDRHDAARAADVIGIPFYVWDFAAEFDSEVVAEFVAEYAAGRTPNPCVRCNQHIKFAAMLERAVALGFDAICTGHYARLADGENGADSAIQLHRGVDAAKDQSYVLAVLTPDQLARSIFPLGEWTKPRVRDEAGRRGLLVADKPDSSDICFIPSGDTKRWLTDRIGSSRGSIIDAQTGARLGTHSGVQTLTVGQRRGLRLTVPAADGKPRYVVSTDPATREVFVGPVHLLDVDQIEAGHPTWCGPSPVDHFECAVQVRAHGDPVRARVAVSATSPTSSVQLTIQLAKPIRGVAPGQTLVMYAGSRVIGSATIVSGRGSHRPF